MAATRISLLALLSEQMLELLAGQAGLKVGLVLTPGLTGLQDSPDGRPAERAMPVQAHVPGDGSGSPQDRGRGRMAGASTLRQIGHHVGQSVTVTVSGHPQRARIVGRAVFPNIGWGSFTRPISARARKRPPTSSTLRQGPRGSTSCC